MATQAAYKALLKQENAAAASGDFQGAENSARTMAAWYPSDEGCVEAENCHDVYALRLLIASWSPSYLPAAALARADAYAAQKNVPAVTTLPPWVYQVPGGGLNGAPAAPPPDPATQVGILAVGAGLAYAAWYFLIRKR